jgi:hypothetical protein
MLAYCSAAQNFKTIPVDWFAGTRPLTFSEILCTSKGPTLISFSYGLSEIDKLKIEILVKKSTVKDEYGREIYFGKNSNILKDDISSEGIKLCVEGPDRILYVVSGNNNFGIINYNLNKAIGHAPFNFNTPDRANIDVSKIWIDPLGNLFVAANSDSIYFVSGATHIFKDKGKSMATPFVLYRVG